MLIRDRGMQRSKLEQSAWAHLNVLHNQPRLLVEHICRGASCCQTGDARAGSAALKSATPPACRVASGSCGAQVQ